MFLGSHVHVYDPCLGMCGSVSGVCGCVILSVVPTREMAMVTMSAVDVVVVVIDVTDDMLCRSTG